MEPLADAVKVILPNMTASCVILSPTNTMWTREVLEIIHHGIDLSWFGDVLH